MRRSKARASWVRPQPAKNGRPKVQTGLSRSSASKPAREVMVARPSAARRQVSISRRLGDGVDDGRAARRGGTAPGPVAARDIGVRLVDQEGVRVGLAGGADQAEVGAHALAAAQDRLVVLDLADHQQLEPVARPIRRRCGLRPTDCISTGRRRRGATRRARRAPQHRRGRIRPSRSSVSSREGRVGS